MGYPNRFQDFFAAIASGEAVANSVDELLSEQVKTAHSEGVNSQQIAEAKANFLQAVTNALSQGISPEVAYQQALESFQHSINASLKAIATEEQQLLQAITSGNADEKVSATVDELLPPSIEPTPEIRETFVTYLEQHLSLGTQPTDSLAIAREIAELTASLGQNADEIPEESAALLKALTTGEGLELAINNLGGEGTTLEVLEEILSGVLASGASTRVATNTSQNTSSQIAEAQANAANNLAAALASGENIHQAIGQLGEDNANNESFESALSQNLTSGMSLEDAITAAQATAAKADQAQANAAANTSNSLTAALASGKTLDQTTSSENFETLFSQHLAAGLPPSAAAELAQKNLQQLNETRPPVDANNSLATALASGQNIEQALKAINKDDISPEALEELLSANLARGISPDIAAQQVQQTAEHIQAAQAIVETKADNPLVNALASGQNLEQAIHSAEGIQDQQSFEATLAQNLAAGTPILAALNQAQATTEQITNIETGLTTNLNDSPSSESLVEQSAGQTDQQLNDPEESLIPDQPTTQTTDQLAENNGSADPAPNETITPIQAESQSPNDPQTDLENTSGISSNEPISITETTSPTITNPFVDDPINPASAVGIPSIGGGNLGLASTRSEQLTNTTSALDTTDVSEESLNSREEPIEEPGEPISVITENTIAVAQTIPTVVNPFVFNPFTVFPFAPTTPTAPFGSIDEWLGDTSPTGPTVPTTSTENPGLEVNIPPPAPTVPPIPEPATNRAPVNPGGTFATDEDTPITGNLNTLAMDPEGSPLTFELLTQSQFGTIDFDPVGAITYTPNTNYNGNDSITYSATDALGMTTTATLNFTVNAVNDLPVIISTAQTGTITETTDVVNGTDADPASATGTISFNDVDLIDTLNAAQLDDPSASVTAFAVTASTLTLSASQTTALENAFSLDDVALSNASVMSGDGSTGWTYQIANSGIDFLGTDDRVELTFTVTVNDNNDGTATQDVVITLNGTNDAPIISGPDTAALTETNAALSSTGTLTVTDVDTTDLVTASIDSFAVSGTSNRSDAAAPTDAQLQTMLSITPTAILDGSTDSANLAWHFNSGTEAFDYLATGETLILEYTIKAEDDDGTPLSDTETVTITITGSNDTPAITSDGGGNTAAVNIDENTTAVTTVTATDLDTADSLSYSIIGGDDAALFDIDAASGALSFKTAPDFENATDANTDNTYNVTVQTSDGTATDTQTIAVTVNDMNEAPTAVTLIAVQSNIDENTDTSAGIHVANIAVTDDALGTNALTVTGADAAEFEIRNGTELYFIGSSPDYETKASYDVAVTVDDTTVGSTPDATSATFTLDVNNLAEISITSNGGSANATLSIDENTTAVTTITATADPVVLATNFDGNTLDAHINLDIPNSSIAGITLDTVNDELDFSASGNTLMWNVRQDAPVAWIANPNVAIGETWTVETQTEFTTLVDGQFAGIMFYDDVDGGMPELNYMLRYRNEATPKVHLQGQGDDNPNSFIALASNQSSVYLKVDITENGASDIYNYYYKTAAGDTWTQLGGQAIDFTSNMANDRVGIFYKTTGARDGASFDYFNITAPATITYSIAGGADQNLFNINANTGALSFKTAPDFETHTDADNDGIYDVTVQASDGTGASTQNIAVTVTDVNEAPSAVTLTTVTSNIDENIDTSAGIHVANIAVTDDGLGSYTLGLTGADAADFEIRNDTKLYFIGSSPDYETKTSYDVAVTADDTTVGSTPDATSTTFSLDVNNVSEIDITSNGGAATAAFSIAENTIAATTITTIDLASSLLTSFEGNALDSHIFLDVPNASVANITLDTINDELDFAASSSTNMWNARLDAPIAWTANPNVTIGETWSIETHVQLASVDSGQEAGITFYGNADGGLPDITFGLNDWRTNHNTLVGLLGLGDNNPNESAVLSGYQLGVYLKVEVTENGASDLYNFYYKSAENDAWSQVGNTFSSGMANQRVGLFYKTRDAEDGASFDYLNITQIPTNVAYSIINGADKDLFDINTSTGQLSFKSAPDFENHADANGDGIYNVIVQASNGTDTDTQEISITVNDANDAPTAVTLTAVQSSIDENIDTSAGIHVANIAVTDDGSGTNTLGLTGTDAAEFEIRNDTELYFIGSSPDYETKTSYDVAVTADDTTVGSTPDATSATFTLDVSNLAEISIPSLAVSTDENTTAVTTVTATGLNTANSLSYSIIGGDDAALFDIDAASGALSFKTAPDFENATDANADNTYNVTVQASDGTATDTQTIAVNINDVNEAPTAVTLTAVQSDIDENIDTSAGVHVANIAETDDARGTNTFAVTGTDAAEFEIRNDTELYFIGSSPDYETQTSYEIAVTVDDASVGNTPDATSATFTLAINDLNENASAAPNINTNGPGNQVLDLDLNGKAVQITSTGDLNPGKGDFTVEAWFYWDGAAPNKDRFIVSKGFSDPTYQGWAMQVLQSGELQMSANTTGSNSGTNIRGAVHYDLFSNSTSVGWHHVAMVIDSDGTLGQIYGYLDGSKTNFVNGFSSSVSGVSDTDGDILYDSAGIGGTKDLLIGATDGGNSGIARYFRHPIDEVRVWNTARTNQEITDHMNQSLIGDETGLVGLWKLDGNGQDATSNGYHGTVLGGATFSNEYDFSVATGGTFNALLLAEDTDSSSLVYSIKSNPGKGSVTVDGAQFIYVNDGTTGSDSFEIEISDGVNVTVETVNVAISAGGTSARVPAPYELPSTTTPTSAELVAPVTNSTFGNGFDGAPVWSAAQISDEISTDASASINDTATSTFGNAFNGGSVWSAAQVSDEMSTSTSLPTSDEATSPFGNAFNGGSVWSAAQVSDEISVNTTSPTNDETENANTASLTEPAITAPFGNAFNEGAIWSAAQISDEVTEQASISDTTPQNSLVFPTNASETYRALLLGEEANHSDANNSSAISNEIAWVDSNNDFNINDDADSASTVNSDDLTVV